MYISLFQKCLHKKAPFHQKVLHFQYEIPIVNLKNAFRDIASITKSLLWVCKDTLDGTPIKTECKEPFSEEVFNINGNTLGVFDTEETYYIRLVIEPPENAVPHESICGNLYLFGNDELLYKVGERLGSTYGQLVLESTADHFALLSD